MATVRDTITFAAYGADLKVYLGIDDASEDDVLARWLRTFASICTRYLNNPFVDDDTGADVAIPEEVVDCLFECVRRRREVHSRAFGLTSRKTGDVSEGFAIGSRIAGGEVSDRAIFAANKDGIAHLRKRLDL